MGLFSIFKKKKDKAAPAPKVEAKTEAVTEPKEEVRPTPKAEAKPAPMAEAKPAPKAEAKPAPKAEAKPTPKAEAKPAPKAEVKPAPKAEAKPAPKAEAKPAPKAEAKPEPKATPAETKPAVGKFEIKKSKDDRYVFNLYAANKVIVATSQVYSSSTGAMNGIKSVIENAERAPIEDQTLKTYETLSYPKWEIYLDKGAQYRFRLNASNGSCICHSQGYTTKASCKNGIESIKKTAKNAVIDKSYLKKD